VQPNFIITHISTVNESIYMHKISAIIPQSTMDGQLGIC